MDSRVGGRVSQLAHNQPKAGAIPVPATICDGGVGVEHANLPLYESRAREENEERSSSGEPNGGPRAIRLTITARHLGL